MRRRIFLIIALLALLLLPASAMAYESITAENLSSLLSSAGIVSYVDEDGDAVFQDGYGMEYWIILDFPEKDYMIIQSAWSAADGVLPDTAVRLTNECNRMMSIIRCWYEPVARIFYADYVFPYTESGIDDEAFLMIIRDFMDESDVYTDYLIAEGAM